MRKFIYFGHSRRLYDTDEERQAITAIRERWPEYHIVNPNTTNHQRKCLSFIRDADGRILPGKEMEYFLYLTKRCEFGVFMSADPENWTPGSTMELRYMRTDGKPTWIFNQTTGKFKLRTDVPSERSFEEEHDHLYGDEEIDKI